MNGAALKLLFVVISQLKSEAAKELADRILDFVEDRVAASKSRIDDILVLSLCRTIRVGVFGYVA